VGAKSIQRCKPPFANSQEQKILELLREAGPRGVSKKFLVFDLHFTQASSRVHALELRGFKIRHEMRPGDHYVTFVLESSPSRAEFSKSDSTTKRQIDFFEKRATGLPLFDVAVRR